MWFTDFKDEALNFFFDMTEIYLRIDKANRAEFSLHIIEQVIKQNLLKNKGSRLFSI